jgi:hypothetical protein
MVILSKLPIKEGDIMWSVVSVLYTIGGIIFAEISLGLLTGMIYDGVVHTGGNPAGAEGAGVAFIIIIGGISALLFYLLSKSLGYLPRWPFWVAGVIGIFVIALVIRKSWGYDKEHGGWR